MADHPAQGSLREVLDEIVLGRIVKRSRHVLLWERRDVSMEFIDVLSSRGYRPMLVRDVAVEPGERVPAFYLDEGIAYFGWIFWEKFSQLRLRKLFGSVIRNDKGDWAIQIGPNRKWIVYANPALKSEMDIENPSTF